MEGMDRGATSYWLASRGICSLAVLGMPYLLLPTSSLLRPSPVPALSYSILPVLTTACNRWFLCLNVFP